MIGTAVVVVAVDSVMLDSADIVVDTARGKNGEKKRQASAVSL
jgi:hypothetical protein